MIKAQLNPRWAQDNLMKFIAFQIERARRNEISETTISNYYKAAKLFCEMNDISLGWKRKDVAYHEEEEQLMISSNNGRNTEASGISRQAD